MRDEAVEREMYRRAVQLIETRYPTGWGGAGVVHTQQGSYFTSVANETANSSVILCIETGAMLEAHKYNEKVTHCLCLVRVTSTRPTRCFLPCGVCQERRAIGATAVQVAVTAPGGALVFVPLKELQPHHWSAAYPAQELEHYEG